MKRQTGKTNSRLIQAGGEFLLYQTEDRNIRIETRLLDETIWLSINQMAELFGVDKSGISRHLKNIFESGELSRAAVVAKFATTAADGKIYQVENFNLDGELVTGDLTSININLFAHSFERLSARRKYSTGVQS